MSARQSVSIDFFADLACPWCYVGWAALKQAAVLERERAASSLIWRTFLLAPDAALAGAPREELTASGDAALSAAARAADLTFDLKSLDLVPNTLRAHRLVHLASGYGLGEATIDALFEAYFVRGDNIGDPALLVELGEVIGLDPREITKAVSKSDFSDLRAMHAAALKIGVAGAPVAIFNRKAVLMGAETAENYARAILAAA